MAASTLVLHRHGRGTPPPQLLLGDWGAKDRVVKPQSPEVVVVVPPAQAQEAATPRATSTVLHSKVDGAALDTPGDRPHHQQHRRRRQLPQIPASKLDKDRSAASDSVDDEDRGHPRGFPDNNAKPVAAAVKVVTPPPAEENSDGSADQHNKAPAAAGRGTINNHNPSQSQAHTQVLGNDLSRSAPGSGTSSPVTTAAMGLRNRLRGLSLKCSDLNDRMAALLKDNDSIQAKLQQMRTAETGVQSRFDVVLNDWLSNVSDGHATTVDIA